MPNTSAGLLMYRVKDGRLDVLLGHPGGPFWKGKDKGAWSIPKGEVESTEGLFETAIREFAEETGFNPTEPFIQLGEVKQKSGKTVHAWAFKGDCEPAQLRSNTFSIEWPPKSGKIQEFP